MLISNVIGGVIMYGALLLFDDEFIHIVAISFSALILTELLMVALTARTWHILMILGELVSLAIYIGSLAVFHEFFGTRSRYLNQPQKVCHKLIRKLDAAKTVIVNVPNI